MNTNSAVETVEGLIDEANEVQTALKEGRLSNTVARTLLDLDGVKQCSRHGVGQPALLEGRLHFVGLVDEAFDGFYRAVRVHVFSLLGGYSPMRSDLIAV